MARKGEKHWAKEGSKSGRKSARRSARDEAIGASDMGEDLPLVKRPMGRPRFTMSDLPENWQEIMMAEAQEGGGPTAYMVKLGINTTVLEKLLAESEDFSNTYKVCFLLCRYWWETQGRKMAMGEPGNAAVWKMNMINRFNWRPENAAIINQTVDGVLANSAAPVKELSREELHAELERRGLPVKLLTD